MNTLGTYSITMVTLLCGLVFTAVLLARYRDRLNALFGAKSEVSRKIIDVAPGARIVLVQIEGMTVICGINKTGVTALHVVHPAPAGGVS